jgi:hypothetical protein
MARLGIIQIVLKSSLISFFFKNGECVYFFTRAVSFDVDVERNNTGICETPRLGAKTTH